MMRSGSRGGRVLKKQDEPPSIVFSDDVQELAKTLGVQVEDLVRLAATRPDVVREAMTEMAWSAAVKARAWLALGDASLRQHNVQRQDPHGVPQPTSASDGHNIAEYFTKRDAQKVYPWMVLEEAALLQSERISQSWTKDKALEDPFGPLKRAFTQQARAQLLGQTEVLLSQSTINDR